MFTQYRSRYNAMVSWESPLEIDLFLDPGFETLTAEVTVTGEITTTDNKIILLTTNHQTDDYFCSVIQYDEADFELETVGDSQVFEYDIDPGSYDIHDLSFNLLIQTMSDDHRILQAGRVIVSELNVPLQTEMMEFDSTMVGESSSQSLELLNYGDDPISFMFFPPPGFAAPADYVLEAHAIGTIDVEFVPENPGSYSDFLIVTTTHPDYPNFIIDLTGEALPGTSETDNDITSVLEIKGNYPNPFNPETTVSFNLKYAADITVDVYNIKGEKTAQIASGYHSEGEHQVVWDAAKFASGIYFIRLFSGAESSFAKVILMK